MKPSDNAAVMNVAAGLFPKYGSKFREPSVMRQWGNQLTPYTVDEVCAGLEVLARDGGEYMPMLSALLTEIKAIKRRDAPVFTQPASALRELAVPPAMNPYREKLRGDLRAFHRSRTGTVDVDTLAAIDAEVAVVGEHEQRALDFIAANPDADFGRVTREFVDSWIQALVKPPPRVSSEVVEEAG